jgi:putative ABC transport system ATP-binding protein
MSTTPATVIETHGLGKVYSPGTQAEVIALHGVDLTIERGDLVAIMGPSGSGKSTLMNLIGCLDTPSSGRYACDGIDVSTLDAEQLAQLRREKIGFVFQGFNLLSRTTALDNVELPLLYNGGSKMKAAERHRRAMQALNAVGLGDRQHHYPNQLSGGQQQRVAIARSLINEPSIILADEPTGNLDTRTSIEVMGIFQQLNEDQGLTIVLVTHETDIAAYATRVVAFRDGLVRSDSPVRERRIARAELDRLPQDAGAAA